MSVELAFLGTGTCNATSRNPSSLALSMGEEVICVDFGGGAYHQAARLNNPAFSYRNISTIFITHYHIDHTSGLPDLMWGEMWDFGGPRKSPLTIAGPPGLKDFIDSRLLPFLGEHTFPFEVELKELDPGEKYAGSFYSMTSYHLDHGESSTGYLFECGPVRLACSGDTGFCEPLVKLLQDSSHAVVEWSIPGEESIGRHLTTPDVLFFAKNSVFPGITFFNHMYLPSGISFEEQVACNLKMLESLPGVYYFPEDGDIFTLDMMIKS